MAGQETTQASLKKAMLIEIEIHNKKETQPKKDGKSVEVHFNPQTLKVTYSNENKNPGQPGGSASQFVGSGTSKLAVDLLFDTSRTGKDVRATTSDVANFIKAAVGLAGQGQEKQKTTTAKRVPPACRFEWGTFRFDGVVDSLQETLDYFSEDGVPLRSTVALGISGIDTVIVQEEPASSAPGTAPKTQALAGESLARMAGNNGDSRNWKSIAAANNIDDPLRLPAGSMIDLAAGASGAISGGAGASIGAGADLGFSAGLGGGVGFGAGAGIGGGAAFGAGVSAGVGGGAGFGAGVSAGVVGGATGFGVGAGIGARANAAGSAGGSFGIKTGGAAASGSADLVGR